MFAARLDTPPVSVDEGCKRPDAAALFKGSLSKVGLVIAYTADIGQVHVAVELELAPFLAIH